jgi:CBS domain-containing protein
MRTPVVAEVMARPVVAVGEQTPVADIRKALTRNRISAVPVVDGQNRPVGVVSGVELRSEWDRRDGSEERSGDAAATRSEHGPSDGSGDGSGDRDAASRARRWLPWLRPRNTAGEVMIRQVATIGRDEPVSLAARRMLEADLHRLYVLDAHGRLVGVLAGRDVLGVFVQPDDELRNVVEREVLHRTLWIDPAMVTVRVDRGVVSLTGWLERRSEVEIVAELTAALPGVVRVRNELRSTVDDTAPSRRWAGHPVREVREAVPETRS